ncbi:Fibroblast growth factor receptor substrate 2 [Acipenser ruthenus]|uniref:Fibroblast growth factor receptor substrate 2 n=1 Tax=Acipenser ruthenus TaxID=7906 RepID=A0A444V1T7_ACIRT|nr:Fibroblast growth factor receptor substrate 2 [Acipenser ruthenus]
MCLDSLPEAGIQEYCPKTGIPVINVDDDGNELGSGIMELTEAELILHTRKREAVRWPYLCLRRYGYDSNLFSFESGRRCQTGQGIFAFKCARAEEIFNMLQEIMQNNSISVVEEPVMERNHNQTDLEAPRTPRTPTKEGEPQVLLEPEGVKFILGPTPVQRQLMEKEKEETGAEDQASGGAAVTGGCVNGVSADSAGTNPTDWDTGYDSDERKEASSNNKLAYEKLNGFSLPSAPPPRRGRIPTPNGSDSHNANNSAQRRTALLNYENLPSLPPVWEVSKPSKEEDSFVPKTPALNGYHNNLDPMHNYVNTENVTVPQSANKPEVARRRDCTPTVFNFDFRRPSLDHRQLNYIEVEMERGSDSSNPQTPKTPTTPLPQTPTRRTELYSVIDIERTAAMSSLQKALPRDDGTSRKTRHNSTDLPM